MRVLGLLDLIQGLTRAFEGKAELILLELLQFRQKVGVYDE